MATKLINISLPEELLRQIDEAAAKENRGRSEFLRESARRRISDQRWRALQEIGAKRARELGISTEDDVEDFLDSLPE
ncbi:MAG TPA: ribbon-helix-helix domain-containing protein [Thermomicrobiales bacterium]|nr:ribbon-helix-helix domain-containing protein [Thermomicrobiales bacterium]